MAEEKICEHKVRAREMSQSKAETEKKKDGKNLKRQSVLRDDRMLSIIISVTGVPTEEEMGEQKKVFKEMGKNFPNLVKSYNLINYKPKKLNEPQVDYKENCTKVHQNQIATHLGEWLNL